MKDWKLEKTQELFLHGESRQASLLLQDIVLASMLGCKKVWIILLLRPVSVVMPMTPAGRTVTFPSNPISHSGQAVMSFSLRAGNTFICLQTAGRKIQASSDLSLRSEGLRMRFVPAVGPDVADLCVKDWRAPGGSSPRQNHKTLLSYFVLYCSCVFLKRKIKGVSETALLQEFWFHSSPFSYLPKVLQGKKIKV